MSHIEVVDDADRQVRLAAMERDDAVRELLDALAMPDGRKVRRAWERATLLYGRFGYVMQRSAFEAYLDELAVSDG